MLVVNKTDRHVPFQSKKCIFTKKYHQPYINTVRAMNPYAFYALGYHDVLFISLKYVNVRF